MADGRNGSKGIRFQCPRGYQWTYVQQYVPIRPEPAKRAVFSAWLRADEPIGKVGFHLYMTPKGQKEGGFNARSQVAVGREWKRYEIDLDFALLSGIDNPDGFNLRPIVQLHSAGRTIEIDDAVLAIAPGNITARHLAAIESTKVDLGKVVVTEHGRPLASDKRARICGGAGVQ